MSYEKVKLSFRKIPFFPTLKSKPLLTGISSTPKPQEGSERSVMLGASKRQWKRLKARRGCVAGVSLYGALPNKILPLPPHLFHSVGGPRRMSGTNEGPYSAIAFATRHPWPPVSWAQLKPCQWLLWELAQERGCFLVQLDFAIHQPLGHQKGFLIFLEPRSKQGPYGLNWYWPKQS